MHSKSNSLHNHYVEMFLDRKRNDASAWFFLMLHACPENFVSLRIVRLLKSFFVFDAEWILMFCYIEMLSTRRVLCARRAKASVKSTTNLA